MPESVVSFQSLPPEYQKVIQLAQDRYNIAITPLQELAGGWSGAIIYLVQRGFHRYWRCGAPDPETGPETADGFLR